jgi:SAM-dependent methyltransferase
MVTSGDSPTEPQTWHYGVVAKWWAEFNTSGPEIAYFEKYVEAGQPALDVACGTGRLLIPFLKAGLDIDGCDVSPDMIALCRERADREGLTPTLRVQAMHELVMPRTYGTIYICGGFGLGGHREHDQEALRRIYEHLEPGGTLVLDNEVPYHGGWGWQYWTNDRRHELPEPWPDPGERRAGSDGTEYELRSRIVDVDPLAQRLTLGMRGFIWRDGRLVEHDEHVLSTTVYFTTELSLMLEIAGFQDIQVRADYMDEAPTRDTATVVFSAQKSPGTVSR